MKFFITFGPGLSKIVD